MARIPETVIARRESGPAVRNVALRVLDRATDLEVPIFAAEAGGVALVQPVEFDGSFTFWRELDAIAVEVTPAGEAAITTPIGGELGGGGLPAPEDWHDVGAVGEVPFENSWANDPASVPAGFYKDALGIVRLKGCVVTPAAPDREGPMFTLPVGYRPAEDVHLITLSHALPFAPGNTDFSAIRVAPSGAITGGHFYGTGAGMSLANVAFRAA